jgi:uncharacterized membrane protein
MGESTQRGTVTLVLCLLTCCSLLVAFSGCTQTTKGPLAHVILENFSHEEAVNLTSGVISDVTLIMKNTGNTTAHNVSVHVIAHNDKNQLELDTQSSVINSLAPNETVNKIVPINIKLTDQRISMNITVKWDTGFTTSNESFAPSFP